MTTVEREDARISGQSVARFAHGTTWSELPEPVRHRARLAFRDSVGTMVAGSVTAAAKTAAAASEADGSGPVELVATGSRVPRTSGALANAVAASSMDFDDGHVARREYPSRRRDRSGSACDRAPTAGALSSKRSRD